MTNIKEKLIYISIAGLMVLSIVNISMNANRSPEMVGSTIHVFQDDFTAGIAVNGTEVINSSGVYVGAVSGTTGAYSSTLSVTGASTLTGAVSMGSTLSVTGATSLETLTQGGGEKATSTDDTTATLLSTDIDTENLLTFTPNVSGITLTLPASSTLSAHIPSTGDSREVWVANGTSTPGTPFTLAAGTGWTIQISTSTANVHTGKHAVLKMIRKANTDILGILQID